MQDPAQKAIDWLTSHGYSRFADGTWSYQGHEADCQEVLTEYIEQIEATDQNTGS